MPLVHLGELRACLELYSLSTWFWINTKSPLQVSWVQSVYYVCMLKQHHSVKYLARPLVSLNGKESGYLRMVLLFKINKLRHTDDQGLRMRQGVLGIKTLKIFWDGILRPHAYELHSFISIEISNSLRERTALFSCECHNFYKASGPSLVCQGFFLMVLIDLYPPEGSELTQLSQVLTGHPHTTAQWNCSTEGYSLRSRQRSGCSWRDQDPGVQVLGHLDWRSLFGPFPPPSFLHFPSPVLLTRGWSWQDTGASLWNPWDLLGSLLSLHLSLTDSQLLWLITELSI